MSAEKENIPVSVSIVACNEEARIGACLESVKAFDDVVLVIDSKSTDKTMQIARQYGCRIFVEPWKGYGQQKQSSIDKCAHDWVFVLDADELLPPETVKEISRIIVKPDAAAYTMPRKNFLHNKWMRHSDFWPDWQTRLVNKKHGHMSTNPVHDRWVLDEGYQAKHLGVPMEHYSFSGYSDMLRTMNSQSSTIANDLFKSGKRVNPLTPIAHGAMMFFKIYFLKLGFLDGYDGFVTAILKAAGSFFKYAKLLELQKNT